MGWVIRLSLFLPLWRTQGLVLDNDHADLKFMVSIALVIQARYHNPYSGTYVILT